MPSRQGGGPASQFEIPGMDTPGIGGYATKPPAAPKLELEDYGYLPPGYEMQIPLSHSQRTTGILSALAQFAGTLGGNREVVETAQAMWKQNEMQRQQVYQQTMLAEIGKQKLEEERKAEVAKSTLALMNIGKAATGPAPATTEAPEAAQAQETQINPLMGEHKKLQQAANDKFMADKARTVFDATEVGPGAEQVLQRPEPGKPIQIGSDVGPNYGGTAEAHQMAEDGDPLYGLYKSVRSLTPEDLARKRKELAAENGQTESGQGPLYGGSKEQGQEAPPPKSKGGTAGKVPQLLARPDTYEAKIDAAKKELSRAKPGDLDPQRLNSMASALSPGPPAAQPGTPEFRRWVTTPNGKAWVEKARAFQSIVPLFQRLAGGVTE